MCVSLAACASGPAHKESADLTVKIKVSDGSNPDEYERPAPVMVRLYELKSAGAFENADFFTLQSDSRKVLGDDAIAVDEFVMRPGDTRDVHRRANSAATSIGVLVGYRELGKSVWRAVHKLRPVPEDAWYRAFMPRAKVKLNVDVGQRTVSITELE
ncbi:hypothetical protein WT60_18730 [Burkholderia sp. MSMB617WGS]|uniref:Type VI secretion system lipoprotein TssJ n=1 Tax=Burkholderia savannae TaxID=1637837 RepID=A0ABR5T7L8_9BURK|nr:hypothetical protein WS78_28925 [Burkholderia savannae]AOK51014.1 hypothetical protein WT60_18730 [Burkholderia sp. MSMB617WGS]KVG45172.1 hypothetical protein WS77_07825 [Burkholderia sp. MSMB0265]KVG90132.1 hypothetical protein WS81_20055 [Burkholderia sp. MSMB2040]KVG96298.1 hypothetical protein WS82_03235 [Burkholderia sp. MSMB2041]KVG99910.1 hypothetical protein WS83_25270 [Burkholderia sp. MSMB2042]